MQTQQVNFFYHKYQSLSDDELVTIAKSNLKYTLEARYAAITILKERNIETPYIEDVEKEIIISNEQTINLIDSKKAEDEKILHYLNRESKKRLIEIPLEYHRILQIRKISNHYYQIRLEHSQSIFSPVVILKIEHTGNLKYYPFFYYLPFLLFLVTSIIVFGYCYYEEKYIPNELLFSFGIFLVIIILAQLISMPLTYKLLIEEFKKQIIK